MAATKNEPKIIQPGSIEELNAAMESMVRNADEISLSGMTIEKVVQLNPGQSAEGTFMGVSAIVMRGFPKDDKSAAPIVRLPAIGIMAEIKDKDGKITNRIVVKMLAGAGIYSQVQRIQPGDRIVVVDTGTKAKTRGNYMVRVMNVFSQERAANLPPFEPMEGYYPPRIASIALANAEPPRDLNDEPMPGSAVALAVAQVQAANALPAPENGNQPALPGTAAA